MIDNKLTDKEVIKALECCIKAKTNADCEALKCPFYDNEIDICMYVNNEEVIYANALDLINRQQAVIEHLQGEREVLLEDIHHSADQINEQIEEIERLNIRLRKERHQFADIGKMYSEIRAEAIKEYIEKLKDLSYESDLYDRNERWVKAVTVEEIDETYKEMGLE